jgi:hypothetical protein
LSATSPKTEADATEGHAADARPAEFRPYRRFVTLVALTIIFTGVSYLILSVAVTIYRQRHSISAATPIAMLSREELSGCLQELSDVTVALEKHLEKAHYLLGGYEQEEAQRWAGEGDIWRNQWRVLGERCRFGRPVPTPPPREYDELDAAYKDLGDTATVYTKELLRFVKDQAPRLDRLRSRLTKIGERLAAP